MTKNEQIIEKVVVTFFEGAIPYLSLHSADLAVQTKVVLFGAFAAGLSLAYNLVRQSTPTIVAPPALPIAAQTVGLVSGTPLNGVNQLASSDLPGQSPPIAPPTI